MQRNSVGIREPSAGSGNAAGGKRSRTASAAVLRTSGEAETPINNEALRLVDDLSTIIERADSADLTITAHLLKMARLDLLLNAHGISGEELKTFSAIVDTNLDESSHSEP